VRAAIALRAGAAFLILCQVVLLARDLADPPVFIAALVAGFLIPVFLAARGRRGFLPPAPGVAPLPDPAPDSTSRSALRGRAGIPGPLGRRLLGRKGTCLPGLLILALLPWALRLLIGLAGFTASGPGTAPGPDGLLLNFDRNSFVFLIPYYWIGASTLLAIPSRRMLRLSVGVDLFMILVVYSLAHTAGIGLYRWPVVMIAVFGGIGFLEMAALILSIPAEYRPRRGERAGAVLTLLVLVVLGGVLFIKPSQEKAVEQGGGLLTPNLFSFDFSKVLKLESQISMNDDLALIVKKDPDDDHILLRRYVLSGYSREQGFFRVETYDERDHPQRLPDRPLTLPGLEGVERRRAVRVTNQEYYLVNFDSQALIGMNQPVQVIPYVNWDTSSFSSVYAVRSITSDVFPLELIDLPLWPPGPEILELSEEEYRLYTEYGGDQRLRAYAEQITEGVGGYWDRVQGIYEWLKFGDYRYSLRAGIAPDGDQLSHFLFTSKKGYCSYFAFSCALLLRSLGIPTRVGAGFFLDPAANTFDYYPVRSDMAHAWVEVWFPGYGWIEYDPTTNNLAEGEEFRLSAGVPQELFERLMREIFNNRTSLKAREGANEEPEAPRGRSLGADVAAAARKYWAPVLTGLLALLLAFLRLGPLIAYGLAPGGRRKALRSWDRAVHLLRLAGLRRRGGAGEAEWARDIDRLFREVPGAAGPDSSPVYGLYRQKNAARFAPDFTAEDLAVMKAIWPRFIAAYRRAVPRHRRFFAWVAAPAAMLCGPSRPLAGGRPGKGPPPAGLLPLLALLCALGGGYTGAQDAGAQDGEGNTEMAEALLAEAQAAEEGEYWDRAIEVYQSGGLRYPGDIRFPWALGNLYQSRSLYRLAWDEYRRAEKLDPLEPELLYRLARTAGYLNLNAVAVDYLERLLALAPDHRDAIGQLGWMYYKVHRQADGDRLLRSAMERFPNDPDYAMTLGTLNADLFRYDEGKRWYLNAIEGALFRQDTLFASVAHYNLSIMESRFYHFDRALDATNASLDQLNRSSGRLARGELYLRQLDFRSALSDYEEAYNMDSSPLSRLNLAQLYQIAGRLEEARVYAEDCLKAGDMSWMLNYGIDPVRYLRDIHEILYKTYEGLTQTERFRPYPAPGEWIRGKAREVSAWFKAEVHRRLFRKYSYAAAKAYGGPHLDAMSQYYQAFEGYPRRALRYLRAAQDFEVPLIPAAEPEYNYKEGRLMGRRALTEASLGGFDPLWERDMIADVFIELSGDPVIAEELYRLNPGALRQRGIRLPVELRFSAADLVRPPPLKRIEGMLKKAGFRTGVSQGLVLTLNIEELGAGPGLGWAVYAELVDRERRNTLVSRGILLPSSSRRDTAALARELADAVFTPN
jgi:tetratricopeptide (TPR) repeat protein